MASMSSTQKPKWWIPTWNSGFGPALRRLGKLLVEDHERFVGALPLAQVDPRRRTTPLSA